MLYPRSGDRPVRWVETPADLQGNVALHNKRDVLAFVRLFTSQDTHFMGFVLRAEDGDSYIRAYEVYAEGECPGRRWGVVPRDVAERLRLKPARVMRKRDHWVVRRNLVVYRSSDPDLFGRVLRSKEIVRSDGTYVFIEGQPLAWVFDLDIKGPDELWP